MRVVRHIVTVATVLSLVICACACVFWVRSYDRSESIVWRSAHGLRSVRTGLGIFEFRLVFSDWSDRPAELHGPRYESSFPYPRLPVYGYPDPDERHVNLEWRGFAWHETRNSRDDFARIDATVPCWSFALACAELPLAWAVWQWLRVRRCRREIEA